LQRRSAARAPTEPERSFLRWLGYAGHALPSLDPQFHGTARFRIVSRLAVGASGEVYKVIDEQRGAFVALRTLRNVPAALGNALERDFRALKDVRHPALASLGDLLIEGGLWFFTMELVEGESLLDYARPRASADHEAVEPRTRAFSEVRLRSALVQLVRGLCALHDAGRVHGALGPDHVRVTAQGRLVLLESELRFTQQGLDADPGLLRALPFVAPERLEDAPTSAAADWYAVGALLYQALSGISPFANLGADLLEQKQRIVPDLGTDRAIPQDLAQLCRALLAIDPDARPDDNEVRAALGIAMDSDGTRASQSSFALADAPPFVGRRRDLQLLVDSFERTRHGAVSTICLQGPAGVGKRTLAAQLTRKLRTDYPQLVHLWGRAEPDGPRAFRGIGQAVDALARYMQTLDRSSVATLLPPEAGAITRMFPAFAEVAPLEALEPGHQDPRALRRTATRALRALVRNLSKRHPLIVVLEDMQCADADGLYVLESVLRPPQAPDMLVVITAQGDGRSSPEHFSAFIARNRDQITQMPLRAVPLETSLELAERLLSAAAAEGRRAAQRIAADAQGLPLRVDALARHFLMAGAVPREGLPLHALLWARIEQLPMEAREVMTVLGLARCPLSEAQLSQVTDLKPEAIGRIVHVLRRENLLRCIRDAGGDRCGLAHPALRAAVRSNARVQPDLIHVRIAAALANDPDSAEVAVAHYRAAGAQAEAMAPAELAADRARDRLALDAAMELFQEAVDLAELTPRARGRLRIELAHAYAHAGQSERAATAYVEAAQLNRGAEALELERSAAQQLLRAGHVSSGLAMVENILSRLDVRLPRSASGAKLSLLYHRARLAVRGSSFKIRPASSVDAGERARADMLGSLAMALAMIDLVRGADVHTRHLLLALRLGDPIRVARAVAVEAGVAAAMSEPGNQSYRVTLQHADALADQTGDQQAQGLVLSVRASLAFLEGRFREHVQLSFEAERKLSLSCPYVDWEIGRMRVFRAIARTLLGELKANAEAVADQIREARERGDRYTEVHLAMGSGYLADLAADDPLGALNTLQEGAAAWEQDRFHLHSVLHLRGAVESEVYARQGRPYSRVMAAWPDLARSSLLRLPFVGAAARHLRAVAAIAQAQADQQDRELLLADADDCGNKLVVSRAAYVMGYGYAVRAGVSCMRGERERAIQRLEHAEAAFYEGEMTLYAAATRYQLGRLQGGSRGQDLSSRAHEWLRAQGVRRPSAFVGVILPGFD
jgi:tetratricopeptide (TPR) repeat protein